MTDRLFDTSLLRRRRARTAEDFPQHAFLLERAAEEILSRLRAVVRHFAVALHTGAHHGSVTEALRTSEQLGLVIAADTCFPLLRQAEGIRLVCDEAWFPISEASLDLVVSTLSLQFVNDLPGALVQIRRALKPDGLFLAALLGENTLSELREAFAAAESELEHGASPRVAPLADVRQLGGLLQRAGFTLPVTDVDRFQVTYDSLFALMNDLRAMGATNVLTARSRKPLRRETLFRAAEIYASRFAAPGGRISATFDIVYLAGWAPAPEQPQPLAPGSATTRLADVLGRQEVAAAQKAKPEQE